MTTPRTTGTGPAGPAGRTALRRLLPAIAGHRRAFLGTLASNLLNQVAAVLAAVLAAWLVGRVLAGTGAGPLPVVAAALAACVVVVVTVGTWWEMLVAHDLAYLVLAELRVRLYDALARVAPGRLLGRRSGDVAATVLSDVEILEWLYAHTIAQVLTAAAVLAGGLVGLGLIDPVLLLVVVPLSALLLAVPWWSRRPADRHGRAVREATGELTADVVDTVQGMRELTAFGALDRRRALLARRTATLGAAQRVNAVRAGAEAALTDALLAVAGLAALLVVVASVRDGTLDLALAPVAVVLAGAALGPAAAVAVLLKEAGTLRAAADRVFTVIEAPSSVREPSPGRQPPPGPLGVRFSGVVFRYRDEGPDVLRGVSLDVRPGETVALVGPSGAGKSTCVNLLLRYWDPSAGTVEVGGVDLRELSDTALRAAVTVVPQDVHLFAGTIADNIRLGRPDADPAEVEAAADVALVTTSTAGLPDGLGTLVGERGVALSGGQRARVAVARALLTDAPVLVLDEAVANLDAESEDELAAALDAVRQGRATLVVAHRLSTIRRADRVVVLEDGVVTEEGRYADLVARGGRLSWLLAAQLR